MTRSQCLGLLIRDMIEGHPMELIDQEGERLNRWITVETVDVSDADNPVVHFEDGSTLTVRIVSP